MAILLGSRDSGHTDTISRLSNGRSEVRLAKRQVDGLEIIYHLMNLLAANDQALLFLDGWVGIAYASPYRVHWRKPIGTWVRGEQLAVPSIRVDEAERRAVIERRWLTPGYTGPRWTPDDFPGWPSILPPFERNALIASPEGFLVVRRTPSAKVRGVRHDFVDRMGRLVATLTLADNQRLLGFGGKWVYVVTRDTDDLEQLHRHPWTHPLIEPPRNK